MRVTDPSCYRSILDENLQLSEAWRSFSHDDAARFIQAMLVPTCGNLFRGTTLAEIYPIPSIPDAVPRGNILDVGCNWGRWSIAAARSGRRVVAIDIHLKALLAARQLIRKAAPGNEPLFVLADARCMPFARDSFDGVFSYSVVQHFSKDNAILIFREIGRVLKRRGTSVIQMPNRVGMRNLIARFARGWSDDSEFDVRYYSIRELLDLSSAQIGASKWAPDCYFGLNVHADDREFVPAIKRWIVDLSTYFLWASKNVPTLGRIADSVFVIAPKH